MDYDRTVETGIVLDESSFTLTDAEIAADLESASDWLFRLTGATLALHGIDRVPSTPASMSGAIDAYHATRVVDPPHFVMILAGDEAARTYGGYAVASSALPGFCNDFVSPTVLGNRHVYGAVVNWTHRYAACGYNREHNIATGEWRQVSTTSLSD